MVDEQQQEAPEIVDPLAPPSVKNKGGRPSNAAKAAAAAADTTPSGSDRYRLKAGSNFSYGLDPATGQQIEVQPGEIVTLTRSQIKHFADLFELVRD